jgi:hypothetical protein
MNIHIQGRVTLFDYPRSVNGQQTWGLPCVYFFFFLILEFVPGNLRFIEQAPRPNSLVAAGEFKSLIYKILMANNRG